MKRYYYNLFALLVFLFALACSFLAIFWPDWRIDIRAQYYDCYLPELPDHFDWREHTNLPPVKDQGQCGSCWAFSAVGAVECTYAAKYGVVIDLSEQNLVSNCFLGGSCLGGQPIEALDYIKNFGIVDENCFPYTSQSCVDPSGSCTPWCEGGLTCSYPTACNRCDDYFGRLLLWINDHKRVSVTYHPDLVKMVKEALICYGPFSATSIGWGHAVVIIGYDDNTQSWIIRNSWGINWGDEGYGSVPYYGHEYSDLIMYSFYILP